MTIFYYEAEGVNFTTILSPSGMTKNDWEDQYDGLSFLKAMRNTPNRATTFRNVRFYMDGDIIKNLGLKMDNGYFSGDGFYVNEEYFIHLCMTHDIQVIVSD